MDRTAREISHVRPEALNMAGDDAKDPGSVAREHGGGTIVIKYGAAAMEQPHLRELVARDIAFLYTAGVKIVVVHGGGARSRA